MGRSCLAQTPAPGKSGKNKSPKVVRVIYNGLQERERKLFESIAGEIPK